MAGVVAPAWGLNGRPVRLCPGSRSSAAASAAAKESSDAAERRRRETAAARSRFEAQAEAAGRAAQEDVLRKTKGIEEEVDDMLAELKKKMGKL